MSAACRFCYAEAWAKRTGHDVWGKSAERRTFGDKHWDEPLRWNRAAENSGVPKLVFCASMADVYEDHPELPPQRERLWDLIGRTPWLTWQLLTKRPENIAVMAPWGDNWPANVWQGVTVEDQEAADQRIPPLSACGAKVRFLSCEPLLEWVNLNLSGIHWVIGGGESGPKARPSHPEWFRSLRDQCNTAGVPFLFKQWGEHRPRPTPARVEDPALPPVPFRAGPDPYPLGWVEKVGKKAAGRDLDGRTWDEMPERRVSTSP